MDKKENKITYSIIIPTYNSSKYIIKTITSIKSFFKDEKFEIIIVDDGSQDNINDVIKRMHCSLVKFIQQDHCGVSTARNLGISKAIGTYIMFCDADDTLCGKIHGQNFKEDIVSFSIRCRKEKCYSSLGDRRKLVASLFGFNQSIDDFPAYNGCSMSKLFRRKFLLENSIFFDEHLANSEDIVFNIQAILAANQVRVVSQGIYRYYQRPTSVTHSFDEKLLQNHLYFIEKVSELLPDEEKLLDQIKGLYLYQLVFRYFAYINNYRKAYQKWAVTLKQTKWNDNLNRPIECLTIQIINHLGIGAAVSVARFYNLLKKVRPLAEITITL